MEIQGNCGYFTSFNFDEPYRLSDQKGFNDVFLYEGMNDRLKAHWHTKAI